MTPGIFRNVASTPQKPPAANVAFSMRFALQVLRWNSYCPSLDERTPEKSQACKMNKIEASRRLTLSRNHDRVREGFFKDSVACCFRPATSHPGLTLCRN